MAKVAPARSTTKYSWALASLIGVPMLLCMSTLVRVAQGLPGKSFGEILPEKIQWGSLPAYPPAVRLAVLVGDTSAAEPYAVRVKVPDGVKFMPHRHSEDRIYTVISGIFYIGIGEAFDPDKLRAYPPGSVIVLPGNTPHFHWARSGEYVTQVSAMGPLGLDYVNPKDDPRRDGQ